MASDWLGDGRCGCRRRVVHEPDRVPDRADHAPTTTSASPISHSVNTSADHEPDHHEDRRGRPQSPICAASGIFGSSLIPTRRARRCAAWAAARPRRRPAAPPGWPPPERPSCPSRAAGSTWDRCRSLLHDQHRVTDDLHLQARAAHEPQTRGVGELRARAAAVLDHRAPHGDRSDHRNRVREHVGSTERLPRIGRVVPAAAPSAGRGVRPRRADRRSTGPARSAAATTPRRAPASPAAARRSRA